MVLVTLFLCGLIVPLATSARALDAGSSDSLNGWIVFIAILTVLASGLYLQSTRRQTG